MRPVQARLRLQQVLQSLIEPAPVQDRGQAVDQGILAGPRQIGLQPADLALIEFDLPAQ